MNSTGIDVKLLGGLLMIVGTVDLIIIAMFPSYNLKLFGAAVSGPSSFLVKLHSPAVHLLIGYGFLWLRPWAWGLSVAYAGFRIVSEAMNQLVFGFHPIRSAPDSWQPPLSLCSTFSGADISSRISRR